MGNLQNIVEDAKLSNFKKEIAKEARSLIDKSLIINCNSYLRENFDLENKSKYQLLEIYSDIINLKRKTYNTIEDMVLEGSDKFTHSLICEMLEYEHLLEVRFGRGIQKGFNKGLSSVKDKWTDFKEPKINLKDIPTSDIRPPVSQPKPEVVYKMGPERGLTDDQMWDERVEKLKRKRDELEITHSNKLGQLYDLATKYKNSKNPEELRSIRQKLLDGKNKLKEFETYKNKYDNVITKSLNNLHQDRVKHSTNTNGVSNGTASRVIDAMKKENGGVGRYIDFERKPIKDTVDYVVQFLSKHPELLKA